MRDRTDGREVEGAATFILRIEHAVPDFERWKQAFDGDPVGRERSGVRRYRVLRPVRDPNFVMVDLEFDTAKEAEGLLSAMRGVWARAQGKVMVAPHASIAEAVETKAYGRPGAVREPGALAPPDAQADGPPGG